MEKGPIILDTSSLIYAVKNRIDLKVAVRAADPSLYPVIPQCVMNELLGLSNRNTDAKTALAVYASLDSMESEGRGDECLLKLAGKTGSPVLTNDRELTRQLKKMKIRVFQIKQRRYVGEVM